MTKISENPHIPSKASESIEVAKQVSKTAAVVRDDVPKGSRAPIKDFANRDRFGRNESH